MNAMATETTVEAINKPQQKLVAQLTATFARATKQVDTSAIKEALTLLLEALSKGNISVSLNNLNLGEKLLKQGVACKAGGFAPMIIANDKLYLARYYHYQQQLNTHLAQIAQRNAPQFSSEKMKKVLDKLFPLDPQLQKSGSKNWQKVAASLALHKSLSVISGGPGTGKTTTVLKLLTALYEAQKEGERELQIRLAAPTGKAAARMQESIRTNIEQLQCNAKIKEKLNALTASTLHRLLGYKHHSVNFRHDAGNPLALDVLVVDESSMIDATMMAKLLDAVPAHARIILLGDKDQLPPVDPGSPFADICCQFGFSEIFAKQLENLSGETLSDVTESGSLFADNLVFLQHSFRFGAQSGIGNLARAINNSDIDCAIALLNNDAFDDIHWEDYSASVYRKYDSQNVDPIVQKIKNGFADYKQALKNRHSFAEINKAFQQFCILTCIRKGHSGLEATNEIAQHALGFPNDTFWYHGRPIMITRNDYQTKLYNGDVGLCLDLENNGELRVYFPTAEEPGYRTINPSRMPAHETAFAMTVHKSQGSEFGEVLFLLPEQELPIMTKQLIYTAITRAKNRVEMWGKELTIYKE